MIIIKNFSLWQYCKGDPYNNIIQSFKHKIKITGNTPATGKTKDVKIAVPLNYLSNFLTNLKMPLIYCEIILDLIWSKKCLTFSAVGITKFKITDTEIYVSILTLLTEDNVKLLKEQ